MQDIQLKKRWQFNRTFRYIFNKPSINQSINQLLNQSLTLIVILPTTITNKWPDKSTTSYAMLDFKSNKENL